MKAKPQRYTFDLDFDDARNLLDKPPEPTFTADELNAARGVARAEGIDAGRAEAMASVERKAGDALAVIGQQMAATVEARNAAIAEIERNAIALCTGMMRRLFPEFQRRHGAAEIEALLRESLRVMIDEPRIVIRLNDAGVDTLQAPIKAAATGAGFAGKVVLIGDDMVPPGDCRIEWADGGVERNGDRLWAEIDAAIRRLTDTNEAEAPTAPSAATTSADGE